MAPARHDPAPAYQVWSGAGSNFGSERCSRIKAIEVFAARAGNIALSGRILRKFPMQHLVEETIALYIFADIHIFYSAAYDLLK